MSPVTQYMLVLGGAVLLFLAVLGHLHSIHDYYMYEFRNVLISAFCPFTLALAVVMVSGWTQRDTFSFRGLLLSFPAQFANLSIAAIAALGLAMAVSNVVLIRHEGMAIKNTVGTALELAWIVVTLLVYALFCWMRALSVSLTGAGRFLCNWLPYFLFCMIDYGECTMIGIMIMGWVAAHGKSSYDKDFIIIPGCSISKTGGLLPLVRGRVNRALRYAWEQEASNGRPVCFIPSGGQGRDEVMSEGSAMGMYLLTHSAETNEVFPEKASTNTAENFLFSAQIVRERKPDARVAFATTNYHVLRCGMLAKRAGLIAEGLASSTKWYFWPNGFAREVVAIVNMTRRYHIVATAFIMAVSLVVCIAV